MPTLNTCPRRSGQRGEHQALDDVVDVQAVALLRAVTEQGDRLVAERAADEDRQEALEVVAQALARSVHVGEPHRGRPQPVHLVVQEVELLGRVLRDAVDVDRRDRVVLVDRQVARLAEELAGRGEHDRRRRVLARSSLEERELAAGVRLEVEERVGHRVDVAHLAGEVEHELGVGRGVAHVGPVDVGEVGVDDRVAGSTSVPPSGTRFRVGAVARVRTRRRR